MHLVWLIIEEEVINKDIEAEYSLGVKQGGK